MVVPIPDTTSDIRWLGVVEFREDADSFFKIVSFEAGSTVSVFSVCLTLVGNWHAHLVGVENPVGRALEAKLLVPVPSGAADVRDLLSGSEDALSVAQAVASVARKAGASAIESVALIRDRHADFVRIENPVVRALEADLLVPVP